MIDSGGVKRLVRRRGDCGHFMDVFRDDDVLLARFGHAVLGHTPAAMQIAREPCNPEYPDEMRVVVDERAAGFDWTTGAR